jgi:hypothetical protein
MRTTERDRNLFGAAFLDDVIDVIEYIADNFDPGEVFEPETLKEWVRDTFSPDEVFGGRKVDDWVRDSRNPDDVFSTSQLEEWAEADGYTK